MLKMPPTSPIRRTVVPAILSIGMLAIVILVALTPNTGAIPAQSACQYNNCSTPSQGLVIPTWGWILIALIVIAVLVGLLFMYSRRAGQRPPPEAVTVDSGSSGPSGPAAAEGPNASPELESAAIGAPIVAGAAVAGDAPYVETPQDVGATTPPPVAPAKGARAGAAAAAAVAGGAAAGADEPNIDALMDELDRISGEILKKGPKGGPPLGGSGGGSPPESSS
ncbi:MAG: hypothetical protein ACYDFT_03115 [Thermoplasmata archaeon]